MAIQRHQTLAFLSGSFSGAQLHWSVIEKEAFPIMEAMDRLRHFVVGEEAVRIFTDHGNLMYVFDPVTRSAHFGPQPADNLARWASRLYEYDFVIEHISGEHKVWGACFPDGFLLNQSRQTSLSLSLSLSLCELSPVRHLNLPDFAWPTLEEIKYA